MGTHKLKSNALGIAVTDIGVQEAVTGIIGNDLKGARVGGIGQLVDIKDSIAGFLNKLSTQR